MTEVPPIDRCTKCRRKPTSLEWKTGCDGWVVGLNYETPGVAAKAFCPRCAETIEIHPTLDGRQVAVDKKEPKR